MLARGCSRASDLPPPVRFAVKTPFMSGNPFWGGTALPGVGVGSGVFRALSKGDTEAFVLFSRSRDVDPQQGTGFEVHTLGRAKTILALKKTSTTFCPGVAESLVRAAQPGGWEKGGYGATMPREFCRALVGGFAPRQRYCTLFRSA